MKKELLGKKIICISSVDWDPIWTRKQQIMSRLAPKNKILYIEAPVTLLSVLKNKNLAFKWTLWLKGARKKQDNLYLYSPPPILPFGNVYPFINALNQRFMGFWVKKIAKKLKMDNSLVWTYLPTSLNLAKKLNPKKLIYDCVDEHSEYEGFIDKKAMLSMERDLIKKCDLVFVTALGLYESKKQFNDNMYLLPNAADINHFSKTLLSETKIAVDIASLRHPILGFVGVIHSWIDLDLIAFLAKKRPNWNIVMVGPLGAGIGAEELKALPNVYFVGSKSKEELPNYLKGFDVCLNPFRQNELTRMVSPLKFYEYLASGKPIVSTKMPGVEEFSDIIQIASNKEEFLKAVEFSLDFEGETKKQQRLKISRENSWENRVEFMAEKIQKIDN